MSPAHWRTKFKWNISRKLMNRLVSKYRKVFRFRQCAIYGPAHQLTHWLCWIIIIIDMIVFLLTVLISLYIIIKWGYFFFCRIAEGARTLATNSSIESKEGGVKSPNYPAPYSHDLHFRLHIKAPNTSSTSQRLVVRFKHVDIEFQENCLYDYVGLQSRPDGPMHKLCGHHTTHIERFIFHQFISIL